MKADCCESDALYITASSLLLCELGKRAFDLGRQSQRRWHGPTNFDGRACVICGTLPNPFYVLGDNALCEPCYQVAVRGYEHISDKAYEISEVYVCQMWPDGPWIMQGTITGGLAEMVERFCVESTTESVLHAMAEYIHVHATEQWSFRTLYDSLWMHLMQVGMLTSRRSPYERNIFSP